MFYRVFVMKWYLSMFLIMTVKRKQQALLKNYLLPEVI